MPDDVPETFECFAQMIKKNLLSYQSEADNHYNSSLIEFHSQVKLLQKDLPGVSRLAVECLLKEHEQKLSHSTAEIRDSFKKQMEDLENMK
ncbi:CC180 protein, partial [Chloroceryle aenea]|nr:CC180 protein [Chloroceryle aenea]